MAVRPQSAESTAPVVVMSHGYNGPRFYLDECAAAIASAGHIVPAYDHRNFGDSDGEPRQELDPLRPIAGARTAGRASKQPRCRLDRSRRRAPTPPSWP